MHTYQKSLFWTRTDTAGCDHALVDGRAGLRAHGVAIAATPVPHTCRYELTTDDGWSAARLEVTTEGAGWLRTVRLERATGRWRVTTAEQGDLGAALAAAGKPRAGLPGIEEPERLDDSVDVDLGAAPLFNTLPIRRLGMIGAEAGTTHALSMVWVLVPSLEVLPNAQIYTVRGPSRVRYESGSFAADLDIDPDGYVIRYPGLAERP